MTSRLPWCGFRPPRNDPGQNRCRITTQPKATDTVKVHYKGTLLDGKEFDSSYKRGEPATFPVGGVIAG